MINPFNLGKNTKSRTVEQKLSTELAGTMEIVNSNMEIQDFISGYLSDKITELEKQLEEL